MVESFVIGGASRSPVLEQSVSLHLFFFFFCLTFQRNVSTIYVLRGTDTLQSALLVSLSPPPRVCTGDGARMEKWERRKEEEEEEGGDGWGSQRRREDSHSRFISAV